MLSDKKLAANRANAEKSTGPKTAKGKALSRFGALQHGVFARKILPGENSEQFQLLVESLVKEWQPRGTLELMRVYNIAKLMWLIKLLEQAERRYLARLVEDEATKAQELADGAKPNSQSDVFEEDIDNALIAYVTMDAKFSSFAKTRERLSRQLDREIEGLFALQAKRRKAG